MTRFSKLWILPAFAVGMLLAGAAQALEVGEMAPDFKLPAAANDYSGHKIYDYKAKITGLKGQTTIPLIKLSDYRGKKVVLVEFYHADFGPS